MRGACSPAAPPPGPRRARRAHHDQRVPARLLCPLQLPVQPLELRLAVGRQPVVAALVAGIPGVACGRRAGQCWEGGYAACRSPGPAVCRRPHDPLCKVQVGTSMHAPCFRHPFLHTTYNRPPHPRTVHRVEGDDLPVGAHVARGIGSGIKEVRVDCAGDGARRRLCGVAALQQVVVVAPHEELGVLKRRQDGLRDLIACGRQAGGARACIHVHGQPAGIAAAAAACCAQARCRSIAPPTHRWWARQTGSAGPPHPGPASPGTRCLQQSSGRAPSAHACVSRGRLQTARHQRPVPELRAPPWPCWATLAVMDDIAAKQSQLHEQGRHVRACAKRSAARASARRPAGRPVHAAAAAAAAPHLWFGAHGVEGAHDATHALLGLGDGGVVDGAIFSV